MPPKRNIKTIITAEDQTSPGFKSATRNADKMVASFKRISGPVAAVGAGLAAAGVALNRFAERAREVQGVTRSFEVLSNRAGLSSRSMLAAMQEASRGWVRSTDLMLQANNAMLLGLPVTSDSMSRLTDAATKLSLAMGIDVTKGLESIIVGIGRQSKLWLDNLGIIVDVEAANRKYAATLGKQVGELTDADKKMAFYEETLRAAETATKGLSGETATLSGELEKVGTSAANAADKAVKAADSYFGDVLLLMKIYAKDAATTMTGLVQGFPTMPGAGGFQGFAGPDESTIPGSPDRVNPFDASVAEAEQRLAVVVAQRKTIAERAKQHVEEMKREQEAAAQLVEILTPIAQPMENEFAGDADVPIIPGVPTASDIEKAKEAQQAITALEDAEAQKRQEIARREALFKASVYLDYASQITASLGQIFGENKRFAIAGAIINTASGIARAFADHAFPLSAIVAATVGAAGAAEIATIKSTKARRGFVVPGADSGRDSVPIHASPGEAVLPRELTNFLLRAASGGAGGPTEIHLRADVPLFVERVNSGARNGTLRVLATEMAGSRSVR